MGIKTSVAMMYWSLLFTVFISSVSCRVWHKTEPKWMQIRGKDTKIDVNSLPPHPPYQVALYIDDLYFCGGSLISYEYVLTSAYCIDGASNIEVVFAVNETMDFSMISTEFGIHPDWNPEQMTGDASEDPKPGDRVCFYGWGDPVPEHCVRVKSNEECNEEVDGNINESHICIENPNG